MAKLAYILPEVKFERALFLDLLEQLCDEGLLTRSQAKTVGMLSAARLPGLVYMEQRQPRGRVRVTFGADTLTVGREGIVRSHSNPSW
jgi:hypothetical protein